jgi:gentisate 1,2-dioxygenase
MARRRKGLIMQQSVNHQELAALSEEAKRLHLCEFWSEIRKLEVSEPRQMGEPHVWRFKEVHPRLQHAAKIVPLEEAERRAVVFRNPGLGGRIATTPTHYAAYSLYNPGERAPAHRHTANAARIGLHGSGGYTTVDGVKFVIERGDMVLTPNWIWHDHGNAGDVQNVWFDVLDVPLMMHLNGLFFDFSYHEDSEGRRNSLPVQTPREIIDRNHNPFSAAGVHPYTVPASPWTGQPKHYFYPYQNTRSAIDAIRSTSFDPFEGVAIRLTDPATGGPALPTMDFTVHLVPAGMQTLPQRRSSHSICLCLEGAGQTAIDGQILEWEADDVFCIPNWMWHHHINTCGTDVVLYTTTDEPIMRSMQAWRHQGRQANGDISEFA